jgi:hypothetical protein
LASVQEAMSSVALGQYFRAFLVKLNMVESQLGQMYLGGQSTLRCSSPFSCWLWMFLQTMRLSLLFWSSRTTRVLQSHTARYLAIFYGFWRLYMRYWLIVGSSTLDTSWQPTHDGWSFS